MPTPKPSAPKPSAPKPSAPKPEEVEEVEEVEGVSSHQRRVNEFMFKAGQELPETPVIPSEEVRKLRAELILEECLETIEALGFKMEGYTKPHRDELCWTTVPHNKGCDILEVVDGCCDLSVVSVGTLSAFGVKDVLVLEEVDKSNNAKFSGDAHKDQKTGKWIKPSNWTQPDILKALKNQGYDPIKN